MDYEQMFFGLLLVFFSPGLWKKLSECAFNIFRLIVWNEKVTFLFSYWRSAKTSQPSCIFFCRFGKTVLHALTGTFWGYMVHFKKIKSSSLNNQRMFQLCFETKIVEVVENAFNVYFGTFWEKYFFEKLIVLLICSDKEQKHFGFCRKCFSWDFATAFYVLIGTGLGKTLFVRKLDVFVLPQYDGKRLGFCRN